MSDDELLSMEREVRKRTIKRGNVPVRKEPELAPLAESNPRALKGFIDGVKDLILGRRYKEAYQMLTDRGNAYKLGVDLLLDKQLVRLGDKSSYGVVVEKIAKSNMSFPDTRKIRLMTIVVMGSDDAKDISDYPELAEQILPMYLEEYMHQYQSQTGTFFSETTEVFKKTSGIEIDPFDPPDFDEVDVMAKLHEWGFDVEKIDYVHRYQERAEYWKWLQEQREKV
jgi:hypothetical protein